MSIIVTSECVCGSQFSISFKDFSFTYEARCIFTSGALSLRIRVFIRLLINRYLGPSFRRGERFIVQKFRHAGSSPDFGLNRSTGEGKGT